MLFQTFPYFPDNQPEGFAESLQQNLEDPRPFLIWKSSTVFFKLVVQGLREIGVSYCVHNVTTAVLPSTLCIQ